MTKDSMFGNIMNQMQAFDMPTSADLAPSYPGASQSHPPVNPKQYVYKVKYGRYAIDEAGNPELEAIMEDIARGQKLLSWERITDTKDGDTYVTVKYIIPVKKEVVQGERRVRKAELKKQT